ncbi:D-aminoacyl-tRNA deacylase [Patescibacteria group bacterium]|nr:D-aminoacyl-tRNA deacylase [Patescibacteria group bacterium]
MVYSKFLIVASKEDKAGINITTQLSQFGDFKFYLPEKEIIYTENLDLEKLEPFDFIIFASKHESQNKERTLSVHPPGNWRSPDFGGEKLIACKSSALFFKQLFAKINENKTNYKLDKYALSMEATHHGPLIDKPCIFVEIGSTEEEWKDRKAAFVIAKSISETISEFKENPYNEIAIAIGGPHYCPNFNKIQLTSNVAISHIIPSYVIPVSEDMIKEAINKTEEEVDLVLLDWKGLGKAEQRNELLKILDNLYLQYKKTGEINK